MNGPSRLLCGRCLATLTPGEGSFYVVRIEAVADPTPPSFTEEDLNRDVRAEIERLLRELRGITEQEALDQVYRQLTLYLCNACFRVWIEDPARPH